MTKPTQTKTASASQNRAIAKDAALTGLPTLDQNDMPTPAQRRKWAKEYRDAQDSALKLIPATKTAIRQLPDQKTPDYSEHDCKVCGEHFSTCICDEPQAQHSPLPWHINDANPYEVRVGDGSKGRRIADCREANCICFTAEEQANAALIVASVNHAEALAEALRDCIASLDWAKTIIRDIPERSSFNEGLTKAREALANWEGAKS